MPLFGYDFENECNLRAQKNLARTQYFTDLPGALVKMLNHQAQREAGEMADTVMTRAIVEELDYGRSARANVFIAGDARYGKTRTVFTSCRMYPDRQRLITILPEARESDMITAHAKALFISATSDRKLKEALHDTLLQCDLFFIYNEAHFLVGETKTKNSLPVRLNWLRQRVVDRNLGAAFFVTRQAYSQALNQFVARTHHATEQWAGRMERPLMLPLK